MMSNRSRRHTSGYTSGFLAGLALVVLLSPASGRAAPTAKFDAAVQPLLDEYLKIQQALAADSERGVVAAARAVVKLSEKLDARTVSGPQAARYREIPGKVKAAASRVERAKTLADMREGLKELSRPLALWATLSKPGNVNVLYCSMAKASWLQRDAAIRNPYYGAKMSRCGEVVSGPHKGTSGGHMAR